MEECSFNLVHQPWIRIANNHRMGMVDIFQSSEPLQLAGNPVEKLIVFRLLLAVCQSACRLESADDYEDLTLQDMCRTVVDYLEQRQDCFDIRNAQKPFLQFPAVVSPTKSSPLCELVLGVSGGNATVLTQTQTPRAVDDADAAYILLQQTMFAFGGKKADSSIVLADALTKKKSSRYGAAVGFIGYLHNYVLGNGLLETLYLNLVSEEELREVAGSQMQTIGRAPWEEMPTTEVCPRAQEYAESYLGRLIPLDRFCHLVGDRLHMTEGIAFAGLDAGKVDLSVTLTAASQTKNAAQSKFRAIWANTEKAPWRQMDAFLGFLAAKDDSQWRCSQLQICMNPYRYDTKDVRPQGVWSLGLQLSSNAGEQYVSGTGDFIDSQFHISPEVEIEAWFSLYRIELDALNDVSKNLWSAVSGYFIELNVDPSVAKAKASAAVRRFWQRCDQIHQELEKAVENHLQSALRPRFATFINEGYDESCSKETAKQLTSWVQHRPRLGNFLKTVSNKE